MLTAQAMTRTAAEEHALKALLETMPKLLPPPPPPMLASLVAALGVTAVVVGVPAPLLVRDAVELSVETGNAVTGDAAAVPLIFVVELVFLGVVVVRGVVMDVVVKFTWATNATALL